MNLAARLVCAVALLVATAPFGLIFLAVVHYVRLLLNVG